MPSAEAGVEVARIDPRTGAAHRISPLRRTPLGVHVVAVEPGGGRVALAASIVDRTEVIDIDIAEGVAREDHELRGRRGTRGLLARPDPPVRGPNFGDRYHVHVLDLATGEQWPTVGPDKTLPPRGHVRVRGPGGAPGRRPAHDALPRQHRDRPHRLRPSPRPGAGQTVCIDLSAPFGTGGPGTDALAWREDGTVAVGHREVASGRSVTATLDPAAIWAGPPQPHYHAESRPDPDPTAIPHGLGATRGSSGSSHWRRNTVRP